MRVLRFVLCLLPLAACDQTGELVIDGTGQPPAGFVDDDTRPDDPTLEASGLPFDSNPPPANVIERHICAGDVAYHHVWPVTADQDTWPDWGIWVINNDGSLTWRTPQTEPDGSVQSWCQKSGDGFAVAGFVLLERP
jgi:hypothetical protein